MSSIAAYVAIEDKYQTGLLPASVWAEEMGHDVLGPATLLELGVMPYLPIDFYTYARLRGEPV